MTDPELVAIARRLAAIHAEGAWHYDHQNCSHCSAMLTWPDPDVPAVFTVSSEYPHDADCPFGMALAWVAAHPE